MRDSFERVNQGKNMYAVIKTGGKQYKVAAGDYLKVEKLDGDIGSKVVIDKILMLADGNDVTIGSPLVAGAKVNATVLSHGKGDKVMIFKFHRGKHYRKTQGHAQSFTEIKIDDINGKGAAKAEAKNPAAANPAAAKKAAAAKPAAKKPAAAKPAAKAKQADQQRADNKHTPLTGIPVAQKDIFCTDGIKTSCGSKMLDNFIALTGP